MTEDSPALIFGRQLLGQIFWIREHARPTTCMPDSLTEWGEWRLDPEGVHVAQLGTTTAQVVAGIIAALDLVAIIATLMNTNSPDGPTA
jgi:hypothetical protein